MTKSPLIIISGPTASGKTQFSISLAKTLLEKGLRPEVVNFDSLCFYKELNIGTAKPTIEERGDIAHHLFDTCSAKDPVNAADYIEEAKKLIDEIHSRSGIPILVGGSGFYIRALIKGMYESITTSPEIKKELEVLFEKEGIQPFLNFLKENDPESLETLHENDHYRLIRAVEHFKQTGTTLSSQKALMEEKEPYNFAINSHSSWEIFHAYMHLEKEDHLKVIEERAAKMIDMGLVEEVEALLKSGFTGQEKPLQSIGYIETLQYLRSEFKNKEEYLERISISTRQLAKSQKTFFKKVTPKTTYNPRLDEETFLSDVLTFLSKLPNISA